MQNKKCAKCPRTFVDYCRFQCPLVYTLFAPFNIFQSISKSLLFSFNCQMCFSTDPVFNIIQLFYMVTITFSYLVDTSTCKAVSL